MTLRGKTYFKQRIPQTGVVRYPFIEFAHGTLGRNVRQVERCQLTLAIAAYGEFIFCFHTSNIPKKYQFTNRFTYIL